MSFRWRGCSLYKVLFLILMLMLSPKIGWSYSDQIQVKADELWKAAYTAIQPYGIWKSNEKKKTIQSRWIEDQVVRSNGILKNVTSQKVQRRYRLKVHLIEIGDTVLLDVKGLFQNKEFGTALASPWFNVSPKDKEYDVERDFFMKILKQLEANRTGNQV